MHDAVSKKSSRSDTEKSPDGARSPPRSDGKKKSRKGGGKQEPAKWHRPDAKLAFEKGVRSPSSDAASPNHAKARKTRHPSVFRPVSKKRRYTRADLQALQWNSPGRASDDFQGFSSIPDSPESPTEEKVDADLLEFLSGQDDDDDDERVKKETKAEPQQDDDLSPALSPAVKSETASPGRKSGYTPFHATDKKEAGVFSPQYKKITATLKKLTSQHKKSASATPEIPPELPSEEDGTEEELARKADWEKNKPLAGVTASASQARPSTKGKGKKRRIFVNAFNKLLAKCIKRKPGAESAASEYSMLSPREATAVVCVLLTVVTLIIAAITGVIIYHYATRPTGQLIYKCQTPECLAIKNDLLLSLNEDARPCDNFYGYVCDKWLKSAGRTSFIEYTVREFDRSVSNALLQGTKEEPDRHGMHVLSWLYRKCHHFMARAPPTLDYVVAYARDALNTTFLLNATEFAQVVMFLVQSSLGRGFHTVFSLQFQYKEKKVYLHLEARMSIQRSVEELIRDTSPKDRNYSFASRFQKYIRDVVKVLYKGGDVDDQVHRLVQWDEQFGKILQTPSKEEYKSLASLEPFFRPMTVGDVILLLNSHAPPNVVMKEDSELIVVGIYPVGEVVNDLMSGSVISRALYLSIHLITNVVRFLYLREHVAGDRDAMVGVCLRLTQRSLYHTWPYLITRKMGYGGRAKRAREVAEEITTSTKDSTVIRWMTDNSLRKVHSDLDVLHFEAYEESALDQMDYSYERLTLDEQDFLQGYFAVKRFETTLLLRWLPTDIGFAQSAHQAASELSLQSFRQGAPSWIFIPSAYQSYPIFHYRDENVLPFYINYPTVGALVARQIVRAIGLQKWDAKTQELYQTYTSCLREVQTSLGLGPYPAETNWNFEMFSWTLGFRLALDAMQTGFQSQGASIEGPDFQTAQELYFIMFCLMSCSAEQVRHPVVPKEQCLIPLHSNVAFLKNYKCFEHMNATCVSSLFMDVPKT